jgi:ribosomal protein S18 acetylase RimI-like enzyme
MDDQICNRIITQKINLRKATAADLKILLEFEQAIIKTERSFDPTLKIDPIQYYDLEKMISDPDVEIIVAENEKEIIGSGYARIQTAKPYLQHEKFAYLGFMYLLPQYRGKGINAMIIEKLKEFTVAKGISEMRLEVYFKNEAAIKSYEKSGFVKHLVEMRMPV